MVEAGGLGSVVVDQHDLGVATGKMAAKILKGQKPGDTPVEIFTDGKSVINKKNGRRIRHYHSRICLERSWTSHRIKQTDNKNGRGIWLWQVFKS